MNQIASLKGKLQRALIKAGWLVTQITPEERRHYLTSFDDSIALPLAPPMRSTGRIPP